MYEDEDYEDIDALYSQEMVEDENQGLTLAALAEHCLIPTLRDVSANILHLLLSCLIFRVASQLVRVPMTLRHVISALLGLYTLVYYFSFLVIDLLILVAGAYMLLAALSGLNNNLGPIISAMSFTYLVCNECVLEPKSWQIIRGAEMMVVMKVVSIAFDLDSGALKRCPDLWQYLGYVLCAGTSVFGIWTSFQQYESIYHSPVWNMQWALKVGRSFLMALLCFMVSVCFVDYFIPHESALWWRIYGDALQFRTSHYFVSYLSETAALLSGFGSQPRGAWLISVCEPRHIELPHSLVQVVVYWNKYMHKWLKQYVFRTSSQFFGGLVAVLATYIVSSLLHGLNYPLAAILMSLGLYTYVEHSLRYRLSVILNACVASRPCPSPCTRHAHTARLLSVAVCNWLWSALAVLHLAYLGCIIDTSDSRPAVFPQAFQKWSDVHYISHWIAGITYLFLFCI